MFDIEHDFVIGGNWGKEATTRHPWAETQFAAAE
jgi:hypothetical protein